MAKGNLFLGTAARSVGDVVMYRREGSQVSRVRVRKIANPKTEAQCRQRAYMAPIPKFFSPLAVVLERSFEGLSKSKSYSKFLKVNADKARANDWLLTKGIGFFPLPYQLSQGTLPIVPYSIYNNDGEVAFSGGEVPAQLTTVGDLSTYLISLGYKLGDVVTFVTITGDATDHTGHFDPHSAQIEIDEESVVTLAIALPDITFNITNGPVRFKAARGTNVGGAVIVSRFENDKWRRSTQRLVVITGILNNITSTTYKAAAIASYSNTVGEPNPMVYLDGEELDNA